MTKTGKYSYKINILGIVFLYLYFVQDKTTIWYISSCQKYFLNVQVQGILMNLMNLVGQHIFNLHFTIWKEFVRAIMTKKHTSQFFTWL